MQRIQVKVLDQRIGGEYPLPEYATEGAAGMDLRACIDEHLRIERFRAEIFADPEE